MQQLAEDCLDVPVMISPLLPQSVLSLVVTSVRSEPPIYDFIYVASGEAHKNHAALIRAWEMLADEGFFPSLALTVSRSGSPELVDQVEAQRAAKCLQIHNLGVLPHDQLLTLYKSSKALIYPSEFESFGLPLIEAKIAGIPVLAPELDYVRDVLDPVESFLPSSPLSIARAVKRFLKENRPPFKPMGAKNFFDTIMNKDPTS
jgi:glycosyltransferase involved in cell wall biosynthesis